MKIVLNVIIILIILELIILNMIYPVSAATWPIESQWNIVMKNGTPLGDPFGDALKEKDIVGNLTYPCCYFFNNGTALFFRMRLDDSPEQGQGHLKPFGWGMEIDSNANLSDYEWLIIVNGVANSASDETVTIERNTIQSQIGDPGDAAEYINKSYSPSIGGYVNITNAGENFGGNPDYFISWYVPYGDFIETTGLNNFSAIRVFFGSSSSTHSLTETGADLVGGTNLTLFSMTSDWSTPMATVLSNGSIGFVDANYNEIVNSVIAGNPVYIRVNDSDRNSDKLTYQTLDVILKSNYGDIINITLNETNINSGIFTGSIQTIESDINPYDQILQVFSPGTINATYNDTNSQGQNVLIYGIITVLDVTPPAWAPTPVDQINELGNAFTYDVNATDHTTILYSVNDTTNFSINASTGSITNNTALTLGNYYLNITATDTSLNSNSSNIIVTVQTTTPPETTIDSTPPAQSNSMNATFTFSSDKAGTFKCRLDGEVFSSCNSPKDYTGLDDGSHTFYVQAIGESDISDPTPASYTWNVDTTAPVINLTGTSPVDVELGSVYNDAGATAFDNIDGNITALIVIVNPVDNTTIGTYNVTYNVNDSSNNTATEVIRTVNVVDTTPPVWSPIPSDQRSQVSTNFSYTVHAEDMSEITYNINDTINFTIDPETGIIINLTALDIGTYGLKIAANDSYGNINYSNITITVQEYTKLFTFDDDFDYGNYAGLEHDTVHNQLQLNKTSTAFPFIWVPNSEGTISKVDTVNGTELGRYKVAPSSLPAGGNPSRTTVDLQGNVWVGNRQAGTVVKVGLYEAGQCIDRSGNGYIESSQDTNGDGDITGSELLPWGQDECVLYEVVLIPGSNGTFVPGTYTGSYDTEYWGVSPRGLAIDSENNLWAGTWNTSKYYYINGTNGQINRTVDVSAWGHNAYGAAIDRNGILWSAKLSSHVLRINTSNLADIRKIDLGTTYGIGLDFQDYLFVGGGNTLVKINISDIPNPVIWTKPANAIKGVTVTKDNNVWVAGDFLNTVSRYDSNGNLVAMISGLSTPSGVAVDAAGKIWEADTNSEYIRRINTSTNTIDLSKRIIGSGGHYTYSDMTGFVVRGITTSTGTWTVIYDSLSAGSIWGRISWNSYVPAGGSIDVRVRTAETIQGLQVTAYQYVNNGNDFLSTGRYIQVETTLTANPAKESPILYDLSIDQAVAPVTGTVLYNGTGISGAIITTNTNFSTTTNVSGHYSLMVPPGTYNLTVTKEPEYYRNSSVVVTARSSMTVVQDIELAKKNTGMINGTVTNV